jgi:hypothetical protein
MGFSGGTLRGMMQLTADECRVLGVLVEKELTTPEQYPLTLNGVINGANQKNNRYPVMSMDEDAARDAVEGLRQKGLVVRVDQAGSRVPKYRQETPQKLGISRYELVVLAELMLRGPQTLGELRGRASRMHHLDSLEVVKEMLGKMMTREEPLVRELPPSPGSRAERFAQLLCPEAHPLDQVIEAPMEDAGAGRATLAERVESLEAQVARMREVISRMAVALGEGDPFGGDSEAK